MDNSAFSESLSLVNSFSVFSCGISCGLHWLIGVRDSLLVNGWDNAILRPLCCAPGHSCVQLLLSVPCSLGTCASHRTGPDSRACLCRSCTALLPCKCASGIRGMACPCTFVSSRVSCSWSCLCRATHGSAEALVYRGCPCRGPPVCPPMPKQVGIGDKACGCWCCCVVVVVVVVFLFTVRSRVSWNAYTPARWSAGTSFPSFVFPRRGQ